MQPIPVILVGFGWWGRHMSSRLTAANGFDLVCIVEPDKTNHNDIAALKLPVCESLDQALTRHDAQAVILTSPNPLHEAQVVACANLGKHVFCEKPLALTGISAQRAVKACKDAGVVLGIGHERRFEPALQQTWELLISGKLGTPMHAEAAFSHNKLSGLDSENWRTKKAIAPAAGMTGMGIHLTDLFIWMFGAVASVQAVTSDRTLGWETGDVVSAQLRFDSGMTASLSAILNTPHFMRYHVFGSQAWVEVRNETHPDTPGGVSHLVVAGSNQTPEATTCPWTDTVIANLSAFASAIHGQAEYPYSAFEMTHNIEVLQAIAESAETGQTIALR